MRIEIAKELDLGKKLLNLVIHYCQLEQDIDWLDLCVLSDNQPAKSLYLQSGFTVCGETEDRYRIDGESVAETSMSLSTRHFAL